MKQYYKWAVSLLLFAMLQSNIQAAKEFTREVHRAYDKSEVNALSLENKFGKVDINDLGGDSVVIDVVITVENPVENKAEYLADQIKITIIKSGKTIQAVTTITDDFKSKQNFSIDYNINIPKEYDLSVINKYGNTFVNELEGKGTFDIKYGNLTANILQTPADSPFELMLGYGKADINTANHINLEIKYSKLMIEEVGNMVIESKYSGLSINQIDGLTLESKYDAISIDAVQKLVAESKYSNYKIGELGKAIRLETGYGSINIDEVGHDFEKIEIENSYCGVNIDMGKLGYKLQFEGEYCGIQYPENNFTGSSNKEMHNTTVNGVVGNGSGTVIINSRYGGVKLIR